MSRKLPPCDHDKCPLTHCKQPGSLDASDCSAIVIERGIPPPARKSCNHHKPNEKKTLVAKMEHGDSIVVPCRDLYKWAAAINMRGCSYTYQRLNPKEARLWLLQNANVEGPADNATPQKNQTL